MLIFPVANEETLGMGHLGGMSPIGPGEAVAAHAALRICWVLKWTVAHSESLGIELHLTKRSGRDAAAV